MANITPKKKNNTLDYTSWMTNNTTLPSTGNIYLYPSSPPNHIPQQSHEVIKQEEFVWCVIAKGGATGALKLVEKSKLMYDPVAASTNYHLPLNGEILPISLYPGLVKQLDLKSQYGNSQPHYVRYEGAFALLDIYDVEGNIK